MFFSSGESEKKGKEVIKNLYYFSENQMLDCNQYIIKDSNSDKLALFDTGNGISLNGLFKGMEKFNLEYQNITKVFLTHEHVDHVLGLYPLFKALKNGPPEIYAYGETAKILEAGKKAQICPDILGINLDLFGIEIFPLNVKNLVNSKEIKLFSEFTFQVYYTPGHSLGSICYYDSNKKILIPGDLVFTGGSFGRYDFPGGSLSTLITSIKNVNNLDVKYLLPGHMGISDQGNQQIALSYRMIQSISSFY
ncbi:MAG: MBL fold metallo-hydrolase [Candidatus Lokiarchaeota archaeon]|nr:MBL fold metallo-hydrolase [Candidatus Lokiarchaeota archaeon]